MPLALVINGAPRTLEGVNDPATLDLAVAALGLQAGRVAVEHNGEIVPRSQWGDRVISSEDKLEVVHFVGGGNY